MTEIVSGCAANGCEQLGEFPDSIGYLWCSECYDDDTEFSHVPLTERRKELKKEYEKHE